MKKFTLSILVAVLMCGVLYSPAQAITTETDSAKLIAELMAQIVELQAKVKKLQEQQGMMSGEVKAEVKKEMIKECIAFGTDLKIGDRGAEVEKLIKILGKEKKMEDSATNVFTEDVAAAVSKFQEKHASEILKPLGFKAGTGFLGARTRAKLNQLHGCSNAAEQIKKSAEKKIEALGQITITLQDGVSQADVEKLLAGYGLKVKSWFSGVNGGIISVPAGSEQKYIDKLTTYYPEKIKSAALSQ